MSSTVSLRQARDALVGPVIWAAHFLAVYASESLICRWDQPPTHDAIVASATVLALLTILLHACRAVRCPGASGSSRSGRFLRSTSLALDGLSLVGIGWVGLAAILLGACQ